MPYLPLNEYGVAAPPGHVIYDPPVAPPQPMYVPVQQVGAAMGLRGLAAVPKLMETAKYLTKSELPRVLRHTATAVPNRYPANAFHRELFFMQHYGRSGALRELLRNAGAGKSDLIRGLKGDFGELMHAPGWRGQLAREPIPRFARDRLRMARGWKMSRANWRANQEMAKRHADDVAAFNARNPVWRWWNRHRNPANAPFRPVNTNAGGKNTAWGAETRRQHAGYLRQIREIAKTGVPLAAALTAGAYSADLPEAAPSVPISATGRDPREYDAYIGQAAYPPYYANGSM